MKRRWLIVLLALVLALAGSVLFACGGDDADAPVVKEVGLTATPAEEQGRVGALHRLTYSVPAGCEVTTSVTRDGKTATSADYSFYARPVEGGYTVPTIVFHTAGSYTVTVYAAKDGKLGSGSVTLSVTGDTVEKVSVSDVSIAAAEGEETFGKVGALHKLTYTVTPGSTVTVTAEKSGAPATDFEWDPALDTIVFGSSGHYTVTVAARIGEKNASDSAEIDVTTTAAPTVTLTADVSTVAEDGFVALTRSVVCAERDYVTDESLSVLYRANDSAAYEDADPVWYRMVGDAVMPRGVGQWKVVYTVRTAGGATGEASAEFVCTPAALTLEPASPAVRNIPVGVATDVSYRATGAVDKYDVTFSYNEHEGVTVERGEGCSLRVTAAEALDPVVITVTLTHKLDASVVRTVDLPVCAVENVLYAPSLAADPFDGMPSEVLTSMGHILTCGAVGYDGAALAPTDLSYDVVSSNVTRNAVVNVLYTGDDKALPYVIVENFGDNTATGSFVLRVTATDPRTGVSTAAIRTFTVSPTTDNDGTAASAIDAFIRKYDKYFDVGDMSYSNIHANCRENMVMTRRGIMLHRKNPYNDPGGGAGGNFDFACMNFATAAADCRLEFTFRVVAPNLRTASAATDAIWLGIGVRTVVQTGWAGFFDLHVADGRLVIEASDLNSVTETPLPTSVVMPEAVAGAEIGVRIDRHVVGATVVYTIYVRTEAGGVYGQYARFTASVSTEAGNGGAPIAQYQFTHRKAGGCYAVENVHVSVL